jgi:hypothetical protein
MLNLQHLQQQIPLQQQQLQAAQLENQQRQLDMQDQQTARQAYMDSGGDMNKFQSLLMQRGASPKMVGGIQQQLAAAKKQMADTDEVTLKNEQARHDQARGAIQAFESNPDEDAKTAQYPSLLQGLKPLLTPQEFKDWNAQHPTYPGAQAMQFHANSLATGSQLAKEEVERRNAESTAAKDSAAAALDRARTPGAISESVRQGLITDAMRRGIAAQQSGTGHPITAIFHGMDDNAEASYKATYDAAMGNGGPEAAQAVLNAAAAHAANLAKDINPQVQDAEVKKSVRVASATAPIETAKAIATAKALRQGDNPAVAGVPPAAVGQVQNQAIKIDQEYIKARESTEALGRVLDLAQSGNKAAGSNLPLLGVETLNAINGIKRINGTEVEQYEGAGSLLDKLKGKIGKLVYGQPIPQDVLNDIRELHQVLGDQAYRSYTSGLDSLNQRSGSRFAPTVDPPNIRGRQQQKPAQTNGKKAMGGYLIGHVYGGLTYLGDDPNVATNWKK